LVAAASSRKSASTQADTEVEAATTLGVSGVVLRQVAADAGIDQETVTRQRATRQRTAAWPALLRDRDRLAEALDAGGVRWSV